MSRMANKNDAEVQGVLDKLRAIDALYQHTSLADVHIFKTLRDSEAGIAFPTSDIVDDLLTTAFGTTPTDANGFWYDADPPNHAMTRLLNTTGGLAAIGVDKAALDAWGASRMHSYAAMQELKKIADKMEFAGIVADQVRGYGYDSFGGGNPYAPDNWPSSVTDNYGFFQLVLPDQFGDDHLYMGEYSYELKASWFGAGLPVELVGDVFSVFATQKPYRAAGIKAYHNLGNANIPSAEGARKRFDYDATKAVDLPALFSFPFAYDISDVYPADLFWTGGWRLGYQGSFVAIT